VYQLYVFVSEAEDLWACSNRYQIRSIKFEEKKQRLFQLGVVHRDPKKIATTTLREGNPNKKEIKHDACTCMRIR
jgi:hypothetical protein